MIETQFIDIDKAEDSDGSGGSVANFVEPLTLQEVKDHLIITSDDDDDFLNALNTACRQTVEQYCHISIVEKIITLTTESCQIGRTCGPAKFELPDGPVKELISVESISNTSSKTLTLDTDYKLSGHLYKTITILNSFAQNVLVYKTGYDTIPENLKLAIKNEIAFRYERRGDVTNRYANQNVGLCEPAEYLAKPFMRMQWV